MMWAELVAALAPCGAFRLDKHDVAHRAVHFVGLDGKPRLLQVAVSVDRLALDTFTAIHAKHIALALHDGATRVDVAADGIQWTHVPPLASPG